MKQETRGKVKKAKGRVKEAVGIVTGDKELEKEGSRLRAKGAVEETVGKVRRKADELVEEIAEKVKE